MAKLFQGTDRKILKQVKRDLVALDRRDTIAADATPTVAISTRTKVFAGDASDTAKAVVIARINTLLAMTK